MIKEIKIIEGRETLIFKKNGLFFEVCKDALKNKEDKELCVSISEYENDIDNGVGVGIFIEDLEKSLKENIKYNQTRFALGFIPCEETIIVEDANDLKTITLSVCIKGEESTRRTKNFKLSKDEIESIIEFCKKVLN